MKIRQIVFGALGVIALVIAYEIGRWQVRQAALSTHNVNNIVKIFTANTGKCRVNSPHLNVTKGDTVQWISGDDKTYSVKFLNLTTAPPDPAWPSGYKPKSPLRGGDATVKVDQAHPNSKTYDVDYDSSRPRNYYYYEIFDENNNLCKRADDESDTGLDVGN